MKGVSGTTWDYVIQRHKDIEHLASGTSGAVLTMTKPNKRVKLNYLRSGHT
jgi:hypothetical protein